MSFRIEVYKFSFSELRMTNVATKATVTVIVLPINAYHGQAMTGPATNWLDARSI